MEFLPLAVLLVCLASVILITTPHSIMAGSHDDNLGEWNFKPRFDVAETSVAFKGGKTPKRNKKQERLQTKLMQAQLKQAQKKSKPVHIPEPAPVLPSAPPPSESSADSLEAERVARRKSKNRTNAGANTLFAGETGGVQKPAGLGGNKTLLG